MPSSISTQRWETQVRKGLLDFILLSYLARRPFYGYELVREIEAFMNMTVSEGTIYPLLNRLKREGWVTSEWVEMGTGIPRKYYKITKSGNAMRQAMASAWDQVDASIRKLRKQL